ncbi:hypothetical protein BOTBODRAFT_439572 [Botryobasidium botryosum FD-172 SS1]|uniref:Uncharacterized protein n=1 Tax=Botryobasidium botryosum (strain FD-172 SS1) TaxID=930990 RepID=A0A067MUN0_BOTB1|nr:hypothetical protein BOTBODRAFT_439572 [Botryobasidium botryosum FD-172 SS1]
MRIHRAYIHTHRHIPLVFTTPCLSILLSLFVGFFVSFLLPAFLGSAYIFKILDFLSSFSLLLARKGYDPWIDTELGGWFALFIFLVFDWGTDIRHGLVGFSDLPIVAKTTIPPTHPLAFTSPHPAPNHFPPPSPIGIQVQIPDSDPSARAPPTFLYLIPSLRFIYSIYLRSI